MSTGIVHVWYLAIVCFAERAARKDVCRCEAGGFGDAMEEEDLVGGRDEEDTEICKYLLRESFMAMWKEGYMEREHT